MGLFRHHHAAAPPKFMTLGDPNDNHFERFLRSVGSMPFLQQALSKISTVPGAGVGPTSGESGGVKR